MYIRVIWGNAFLADNRRAGEILSFIDNYLTLSVLNKVFGDISGYVTAVPLLLPEGQLNLEYGTPTRKVLTVAKPHADIGLLAAGLVGALLYKRKAGKHED